MHWRAKAGSQRRGALHVRTSQVQLTGRPPVGHRRSPPSRPGIPGARHRTRSRALAQIHAAGARRDPLRSRTDRGPCRRCVASFVTRAVALRVRASWHGAPPASRSGSGTPTRGFNAGRCARASCRSRIPRECAWVASEVSQGPATWSATAQAGELRGGLTGAACRCSG